MEILRHNVVSDKPNAFNKLLNLFVCKTIDEDKGGNSEMAFQWFDNDTDVDLQMRLNDLYSQGMYRFLDITVTDYQESVIDEALAGFNDEAGKKQIKEMLIKMRLQKNPEFAFCEICEEKTFNRNAKIVREIVELLQVYKFRYNQKHAFLGDFFELLLNTSMKQEVGQFFTPNPITKFIISSLPIEEFINDKIVGNEMEVLPKTIDFACGSGHFLTEYMEQVQNIIDGLNVANANRNVKNQINSWKNDVKFAWARNYVYGIDLDYRLVKTAKVSAFFNGDGEASIVWANGLGNFKKTGEYLGALKYTSEIDNKDNGKFDILISNPPYSVEAFKSALKDGADTFELYNSLTNNSKEIECLFIERTKQLLKAGGKAGIILPSSILSNGGIHSKAREILFKYFKFKAIAEMGNNTFMKTGTNTVILFLERRANGDWQRINNNIDTFFKDYRDVTVDGIENAFSKYAMEVYGVDFADYKSFLCGTINEEVKQSDLVRDYSNYDNKDIIAKEKEKLLYFLLTYPQKIALIKSGEKQTEKNFLGYEFSERRGHEGIKFYPNGTKLYDDNDKLNPKKANSYIYNTFLGKIDLDIDGELAGHLSYARMSGFIDYNTNSWDKKVNLRKKTELNVFNRYGNTTLASVANIIRGVTYNKMQQLTTPTNNIVLTADNITLSGNFEINKQVFINESVRFDDSKKLLKNDCFMCFSSGSKEHIGKVAFIENDTNYFAGGFMGIVRANPDEVIPKYLFFILNSNVIRNYVRQISSGSNINNLSSTLLDLKIPLPPIDIQKKIVAEIETVEKEERETQAGIEKKQNSIKATINIKTDIKAFSSVATLEYGSGLPQDKRQKGDYIVAGANGQIGEHNEYLVKAPCIIVGRKGSVGKVNYFDKNCYPIDTTYYVKHNDNVITKYLYYILKEANLESLQEGIGSPNLNRNKVYDVKIPLPPLSKQKEIVSEIEKREKAITEEHEKLKQLEQSKKEILKRNLE
jgi:type I restriction enzyme M protein